ncbi:murein DD-endopeptidase MepM/ murein hydrolase activator NlpD [Halanaerobium saccharolyticum]|uniref:Murein DD-endopeptidase MepM/ murein hydrolase activator NlpD n=1 Tax=Halanaerobium saccharolyticum TaxID=43595 RepID=A0A4R7Z6C3_9FIRM|nr:M23 family metallopeptidase [Halanaerobium saccharolyticum]RAK09399.1 murein DD-endopeptidase MepM/ murein hydrolase activator NlpD [Halanaerobium saccharolyticum]TDW06258.1 murein DD-endopeptidase MepM/ murein hydrolase activator NlpD [Halanaerobium saccharolyticum]TDX61052.1 murein DD-endopeptidase MepM/ murein hydrolase activator NlpD [Halanaerobium saccharolyticum]
MRRRERLTGFFIIFILLTFSAYSNSMNVGGRIGITNNQHREIKQSSRRVQESRNITTNISDNNINNSVNKDNGQMSEQLALKEDEDSASEQASRLQAIDNNFNLNRDKDTTFTEPRKDDNKNEVPDNQETAFEKRHAPQLIDQVKVHKVRSGETLWDIAHKHGLNIDSLIGANNISNMNSIKPGQEFKILPVRGIIYRVSPGESVDSIARKFELKRETIMKDNNIEDASSLKIDQKLILRGAKPEFSYQDRLDQKFMSPINTRITSYYGPRWGRMHEGIDFAAPMGSPIRAVSSGRVVYSGWATGYGYVVILEHQRGLRTLYAHNSKLLVREGESVGKGEVISRSGNTGNSTGPHLHFEVQVNGRPENPLDYINR